MALPAFRQNIAARCLRLYTGREMPVTAVQEASRIGIVFAAAR
jgi:hypothetical protein